MFDITREEAERHVIFEIGRPKSRDARVRVVELDGRRAIFKDISRTSAFFRYTICRWLLARECRMYEMLQGARGVPAIYRVLDRDGFLIEYIDGHFPRGREFRGKLSQDFYTRCFELVDSVHQRGILHFDLRNKRNFVVSRDGRLHLVDFASAVRIPHWMPFRKWLVAKLGVFDRAGVLKLKSRLSPELLTDDEQAFLRRYKFWTTVLWPPALVRRVVTKIARRRKKKSRKAQKIG